MTPRALPAAAFHEGGSPLTTLRAHLAPNGFVVGRLESAVGDPTETARHILRAYGPMPTRGESWGETDPADRPRLLAGVIARYFHPRRDSSRTLFDERLFDAYLRREVRECVRSIEGTDAELRAIIRSPLQPVPSLGVELALHLREMERTPEHAPAARAVRLLAAFAGLEIPDPDVDLVAVEVANG